MPSFPGARSPIMLYCSIRRRSKPATDSTVSEVKIEPVTVYRNLTNRYPIIEGVLTTTFYGKGVAVAGMKTACGAVLLAGQSTDIVEWSSGAGSAAKKASTGAVAVAVASQTSPFTDAVQAGGENDDEIETEHFYSLVGEDGKPVDAYSYDLRMANEVHTKAGAYTNGETVTIKGIEPTRLVTWLNRDGGSRA